MQLQGKRALVTGASSGLGAHFAALLASEGAQVVAGARREDLIQDLFRDHHAITAARLDVTDPDSIASVFAGEPFDIVINNAGISLPGAALDYSEDDWSRTFDTNLKGAFLVAQAAARQLQDHGQDGAIVNVASILGLRVAGHVAAYAASKAALVQITKATALEWARHGIRVNALCPGYIATDINRAFFETDAGQDLIRRIPQRRLGTPEDLNGALLLLASDAGRYITGATLAVDGGHLVSSL